MKVLFLTVDDETRASSRTRVYQFLPYLKENGIDYDIVAWNGKAFRPANPLLKFLLGEILNWFVMTAKITWALINMKRYDLVFVQKITLYRLLYLLRWLKIKYIYDIDDAIYTLHSAELNDRSGTIRVNAAVEFMKTADMIVELPSTEDVAKKHSKNVTVILGPIDTDRYIPSDKSGHNVVTVGWIGSHGNTFYLVAIQEALENISRKYPNVEIKLIGTKGFYTNEPRIKLVEWSLDTEVDELATFDIGIMPLTDDEWSRGKGNYKILQYGALGIPCVVSPVGVSNDLIKEGVNGLFASSNKEWEEKLSKLIENKALREEMGKNARELIVKNYSLKASVKKFVDAIKTAYND